MNTLLQRIEQAWYNPKSSVASVMLKPLSALFSVIASQQKQVKLKQAQAYTVPVWVIGNISIGGTGKSPVIMCLASLLKERGVQVGIVSRGYGGQAEYPYHVTQASTASEAGDEPLMIHRRLDCPVVVSPNRNDAVESLIQAYPHVQLILSDDGLQHYAMHRDCEVAVIDAERLLGNGQLLPSGPLRERPERLNQVEAIFLNCGEVSSHTALAQFEQAKQQLVRRLFDLGVKLDTPIYAFHLSPDQLRPVKGGASRSESFNADDKLAAIAAIGNPERFFTTLKSQGYQFQRYPFNDHHAFKQQELAAIDADAIVMTEKDAVKCSSFNIPTPLYFLPVNAQFEPRLNTWLNKRIHSICQKS